MGLMLFNKPECPFCWKVRWTFYLADVAYEKFYVDTDNKPPELFAASPKGSVPVLVLDDGKVIDESQEIVRFIDERHDGVSLLADAEARDLQNYSDKEIGPLVREAVFMCREQAPHEWDHALLDRCQANWQTVLSKLEQVCSNTGPWFLGENSSIADCALIPRLTITTYYGLIGLGTYPKLFAWYQRMLAHPGYAATAPDNMSANTMLARIKKQQESNA